MKNLLLIALWCGCTLVSGASAQDKKQSLPNWEGKWRGMLVNYPVRANAPVVEVTMEIGAFPAADNVCTAWRTSYSQGGEVKQVKDYKLCRGTGPNGLNDDLYVDEGGGVKLAARMIGDVLVSPFKYDNLLLIANVRLRGDTLEQEIYTIDDKPAIKGVLSLTPRGIQRFELKRVTK
jgi:hypothetical protein